MSHRFEVEKNVLDIEHNRNFTLFVTFMAADLAFIGIFLTLFAEPHPYSAQLIPASLTVVELLFLLSLRFKRTSDDILNQIKALKQR